MRTSKNKYFSRNLAHAPIKGELRIGDMVALCLSAISYVIVWIEIFFAVVGVL